MEFYGLIEAKDRFGVVGQFGFVGYGFMGVLCCSETRQVEVVVAKDRFGVVGWFGFVGYGFMGVLCCYETPDRWWWWLRRIGGCAGYVVVMVPMAKPQVQSPDRSSW